MISQRNKQKSKKHIAYDYIKNLIIDNELPQNSPLVERSLCEQLGISRTPVREALRELSNEGLVTIIDGKGVYVKKIDFKDMIEIFEVREALEYKAIELFIERIDSATLDELKAYMAAQEAAYHEGLHKQFMDVDMKIHYLIASGSKNKRLENLIVSIYDQIRKMAISSKDNPLMREKALAAHKAIVDAVERKDIAGAKSAMRTHIKETMDIHKDKYYLL